MRLDVFQNLMKVCKNSLQTHSVTFPLFLPSLLSKMNLEKQENAFNTTSLTLPKDGSSSFLEASVLLLSSPWSSLSFTPSQSCLSGMDDRSALFCGIDGMDNRSSCQCSLCGLHTFRFCTFWKTWRNRICRSRKFLRDALNSPSLSSR